MRARLVGGRDAVAGSSQPRGAVRSSPTRTRALPAVVGLGLVVVALLQFADAPVADLAHQLTVSNFVVATAVVLAFAGAGAVIAYHQPRNATGWLVLGAAAFLAVNNLASDYSVLAYRVHHGTPPLGPLAVLAQPSWAPGIVCIAMSILLFPDGHLPPGRWRWGLWAFLALGAVWLGGAFSTAIDAIVTHTIHVNPGGDLAIIDSPTGGAAWWGYVQDVFFPAFGLSALLWWGRQVASYRRARGDRRLEL